jgi:hypothetical protein
VKQLVLEDFLLPMETIKYQAPDLITYAEHLYNLYMTNYRLIFYVKVGLLFKKENVVSERLEDIITMDYSERGLISKSGVLKIQTKDKRMEIQGTVPIIKAVWQELQKYSKRAPLLEIQKEVKEKEIIKEVVLIPCKYCGGLMPQTSIFCPNCGAREK